MSAYDLCFDTNILICKSTQKKLNKGIQRHKYGGMSCFLVSDGAMPRRRKAFGDPEKECRHLPGETRRSVPESGNAPWFAYSVLRFSQTEVWDVQTGAPTALAGCGRTVSDAGLWLLARKQMRCSAGRVKRFVRHRGNGPAGGWGEIICGNVSKYE